MSEIITRCGRFENTFTFLSLSIKSFYKYSLNSSIFQSFYHKFPKVIKIFPSKIRAKITKDKFEISHWNSCKTRFWQPFVPILHWYRTLLLKSCQSQLQRSIQLQFTFWLTGINEICKPELKATLVICRSHPKSSSEILDQSFIFSLKLAQISFLNKTNYTFLFLANKFFC